MKTTYIRFASLSPGQKVDARRRWKHLDSIVTRTDYQLTPLLDCYFQPFGDGVADLWYEVNPALLDEIIQLCTK